MDTKKFFSQLDFDPKEIDDLLDSILLDYPSLIFDLLQKSTGKYKKNSVGGKDIVSQNIDESDKSVKVDTTSLGDVSSQKIHEATLYEGNYAVQTYVIEENCLDMLEIPIIKVTLEPLQLEELILQCLNEPHTCGPKPQDIQSPLDKQSSGSGTKTKIWDSKTDSLHLKSIALETVKVEENTGSAVKNAESSNVESTNSLLRELEEELERLTCVVNETSLAPPRTGPKQSDGFPANFEHCSQSPKRTEERHHRERYLEDPFLRHASKERPHSAFERASTEVKTIGHPLSRYPNNIVEDGQEQELARCFNLKGTFSLGRYNQKKKKDSLTGQKELLPNTSEHLFREFKNWQPLHKQMGKGVKDKKRKKHFQAHNLRESSVDSERSSMMLEELNDMLDQHLENNIYLSEKYKSMPDVWSDRKVPSWCKLHMSRHEAANYLKDKPIRSFVVRSSNSYKGAYGLVLKVSEGHRDHRKGEYVEGQVKNYLIESLPAGVRVKGSPSEPIFPDLTSLIREHCRNQISLPCKLLLKDPVEINLPEESDEHDDSPLNLSKDVLDSNETLSRATLSCNVLYLSSELVESLSEVAAVRKATDSMYSSSSQKLRRTTICQLKISSSGLTLTDTCRSLFFRRFYPGSVILYAGINADDQRWAWSDEVTQRTNTSRIFGVVTRKNGNVSTENTCHLFAELDHSADEIVSNIMRLVA